MSHPQLFFEAVDTAVTLAHAVVGWLIFLATVATILVLAAIATGAWGVNVLRRRVATPSWARSRAIGRRLARRSRDYEEAA